MSDKILALKSRSGHKVPHVVAKLFPNGTC